MELLELNGVIIGHATYASFITQKNIGCIIGNKQIKLSLDTIEGLIMKDVNLIYLWRLLVPNINI